MIRQAIPQLPSLDLARSRDFYERKLDFVLHRQYDDLVILKRRHRNSPLALYRSGNTAELESLLSGVGRH